MADEMRVGDMRPGNWCRGKGKVGQTHVDLLQRRSSEVLYNTVCLSTDGHYCLAT